MSRPSASYDIVVPSAGRASLAALLAALAEGPGPFPGRVLVVDDRRDPSGALPGRASAPALAGCVELVPGDGRGPAAARNAGWRASRAAWIAFLDDDVVPRPGWRAALERDLAGLGPGVGGSQGRVEVPLPTDRRPTDWERNVAGLESARWATADIAYRREALAAVGGFDERFRRAYREDSDLGLRIVGEGWRIVQGERAVTHPVRPAGRLVSVRLQAGNADDALMRALHGARWQARAGVAPGRRPRHFGITAAAAVGVAGTVGGRRRLAALGGAGWLAGTAELAFARIAPGPRTLDEVATMVATSVLLPAAATAHWLAGLGRYHPLVADRRRSGRRGMDGWRSGRRGAGATAPSTPPAAVLLDRDGTLVEDVPYNADPAAVRPLPGVRTALERLRSAGVPLAVVSNQSGVARGLVTPDGLRAVNRRVEELLGPLGPWEVCPHGVEEGCGCRKPAPGLVLRAAERLGVEPDRCAVVGDIGADVEAARAVGARGVLVPTPSTRREEVEAAREVAPDLGGAVDLLLGGER